MTPQKLSYQWLTACASDAIQRSLSIADQSRVAAVSAKSFPVEFATLQGASERGCLHSIRLAQGRATDKAARKVVPRSGTVGGGQRVLSCAGPSASQTFSRPEEVKTATALTVPTWPST